MKPKLFFLRLLLLMAVLAAPSQRVTAAVPHYQYYVHTASSPTGIGKVYVKTNASDDTYAEHTDLIDQGNEGNQTIGDGSCTGTNFDFKYEGVPVNYYFLGWSLNAPATQLSDIKSTDNPATIKLYSEYWLYSVGSDTAPDPIPFNEDYKQWVYANFTRLQVLSANEDEGSAGLLGTKFYAENGDEVRIKATAKAGYTFAGWKKGDSDDYVSTANPCSFTVGDETAGTYAAYFHADETAEAHSVIIDKQIRGTLVASPTSDIAGETITLTVTPEAGYEASFVKYDGMEATKVDNTRYSFTMPNDDVYVSVLCIPITYFITYYSNDGSLETGHNTYTVESETITLDEPTRTGYTFAGWYDNEGLAGTAVTTIAKGSTGDKKFWAKWTENVLTLADNGDNGEAIEAAAASGKVYDVTLNGRRLYMDGNWNTLCLPFTLGNIEGTTLKGFTVKELDVENSNDGHPTGFDDGTLYLNFTDATTMVAGRPYIVKANAIDDVSTIPLYATRGTMGANDGQDYTNLVDGSSVTSWYTDKDSKETPDEPYYCEFNTSYTVFVTGYTLEVSSQPTNRQYYNPTKWTLKAKLNADDPWTTIDSRDATHNADDALPDENATGPFSKDFSIGTDKQNHYKYFRFEVSETKDYQKDNALSLTELKLQGSAVYISNPVFHDVTIGADDTEPTSVTSADGAVTFVSTYGSTPIYTAAHTNLYLGDSSTLYYPTATDFAVGAFRAYFRLNNALTAGEPVDPSQPAVRTFSLNFGDDAPTGIGLVHASAPNTGYWYSLDGRRLGGKPTAKGVYIHQGRKAVVK